MSLSLPFFLPQSSANIYTLLDISGPSMRNVHSSGYSQIQADIWTCVFKKWNSVFSNDYLIFL